MFINRSSRNARSCRDSASGWRGLWHRSPGRDPLRWLPTYNHRRADRLFMAGVMRICAVLSTDQLVLSRFVGLIGTGGSPGVGLPAIWDRVSFAFLHPAFTWLASFLHAR